jgi:hypothetical protein
MSTKDYNEGRRRGRDEGYAAAREECLPFHGVHAETGTRPVIVEYRTDLPPYKALTQYAEDLERLALVAEQRASQFDAARQRSIDTELAMLAEVEDLEAERKARGGLTGFLAPIRRVADGRVSAARRQTEKDREQQTRWQGQAWNLRNELDRVQREIANMVDHVRAYEASR